MDLKAIFEQKKLNNAADKIELPKTFTDKFPDLKRDKAEKLFKQYLDAVGDVLLPRLPWVNNGELHVSTHGLVNQCKDFKYKKQRYYVWNEFRDIYPLMQVLEKGSNLATNKAPFEKNTKVRIVNERFIRMMLQDRSPEAIFNALFTKDDLAREDAEAVSINMENLQNFIDNTEYRLSQKPEGKLRSKLQQNLWQALTAYQIGKHTLDGVGQAILPLIPSKSPFGRTYYKGFSIQSVTKEVRSAIIGPHFQYDMNAAVYGIKLALFNALHGGENNLIGTPHGTYTREYLENKDAIRKRLAKHCFEGVAIAEDYKLKNIKNALTAIGFGAKTNTGFWMDENELKGAALAQIMKSKEARERFLNDPWVMSFLAEQQQMEDEIVERLKAEPEYDTIAEVVKNANAKNGRVTKPLLLAYIYQQWETILMDEAVAILANHGIEVAARVHDAFLVMAKVPQKVMDEVYSAWAAYSSHIRLDCDEVRGWIAADVTKARDVHAQTVGEHRKALELEERKARIYSVKNSEKTSSE